MPKLEASHASEMSITSLIFSKGILLPPQGVHLACCSLLSLGAPLGKKYQTSQGKLQMCINSDFFKHMWIKDAAKEWDP